VEPGSDFCEDRTLGPSADSVGPSVEDLGVLPADLVAKDNLVCCGGGFDALGWRKNCLHDRLAQFVPPDSARRLAGGSAGKEGAGISTCPKVVCEGLTYPKVACLGAMVRSNLHDVLVANLETSLEARTASEGRGAGHVLGEGWPCNSKRKVRVIPYYMTKC
jgi:hypothetical protein